MPKVRKRKGFTESQPNEKLTRDPIKNIYPQLDDDDDEEEDNYLEDSSLSENVSCPEIAKVNQEPSTSTPESSPNRYSKKKKRDKTTEESLPTTKYIFKHHWLFALIFIIISVCLSLTFKNLMMGENISELNAENIIKGLKDKFKEQPPLTFRIILKSIRHVISDPEPEMPAIIMLLASQGAKDVTREFAWNLLEAVPTNNSVFIKGDKLAHKGPDAAKKEIDEKLKTQMNSSVLNTVFVENLDDIPVEAAIMFHSYCDHEYATFKRVIYVMTISPKIKITEGSGNWDRIALDHLNRVWNSAHTDEREPLLTRLTVSVAAIVSKN